MFRVRFLTGLAYPPCNYNIILFRSLIKAFTESRLHGPALAHCPWLSPSSSRTGEHPTLLGTLLVGLRDRLSTRRPRITYTT